MDLELDYANINEINRYDFEGFCPVAELRASNCAEIPSVAGVYLVIRLNRNAPEYLEKSPAGWFKGNDPTEDIEVLKSNWVEGVNVIYIGKANSLKERIRT